MMKKAFLLLFFSGCVKFGFSQPGEFYSLYFEGNASLAKGQYDKAIEKYNAAAKLFSADYIYFNRGNAYFGKKDLTNALADYTKTIAMNKDYAEAYAQRGLIKMATGDNTSCDDFKKAAKLDLEGAKETLRKNCK